MLVGGGRCALALRARGLPRPAAARRPDRAQGHGAHAGPARADVRRRLPRLGAARRRRREVRAEGGRRPRRAPTARSSGWRRPSRCCPTCVVLRRRSRSARRPGRRRTSTLGLFFVLAVMGVGVLGVADGRLGQRQQVLAARRACARRAQLMAYELPFVLAAASVGDGGRHAVAAPASSRRGSRGGCPGSCSARSCSSSPGWPSCSARRSTCRSPTPRSSSAPYTEYTGLRFALFLLAEYAGIVVLCALTTVLFLGGWHGPVRRHSAGCGRCSRPARARRSS